MDAPDHSAIDPADVGPAFVRHWASAAEAEAEVQRRRL